MREIPQYIQQLSMGSMPKVEFTRAQANVTQGISDELYQLGQNIHRKDVEIQKITAKNTLDVKMNELYQKHANDPTAFQQEAEGFRAGFIKGIKSPELSEMFNLEYEAQYKPFFNKAVENKSRIQDQEHELALRTAIETSIETGARYVDGIQSHIPEHVMDTERAMGKNLITFDELIGARKADGSFMFSPAQQVSFKSQRDAKIQAVIKERQIAAQKMESLKTEDFVAWGKLNGLSTQEIVDAQGENASVLSKAEIKEYGEKLSQIENSDIFRDTVALIARQYPGYEQNAIDDLRSNLPASKKLTLDIIAKPTADSYHEQVRIMNDIGAAKESDVNQAYKDMFPGEQPSDIDMAVAEEAKEYLVASIVGSRKPYEVIDASEMLRKVAKEYRRKNPNKSVSEAAKFALKWQQDHYKIKSMNGASVQIPTIDNDGMVLDTDELSERLDEFMPFLDMKTIDDELKDTAIGDPNSKARPVLNRLGDGYFFISPRGEVVLDSSGKRTEIKIKDILTQQTPLETNKEKLKQMRDELAKMPYGERESYRKKMLGIK